MMSIPVTPYDAKLEPLRAAIEAGNSDVLKQFENLAQLVDQLAS